MAETNIVSPPAVEQEEWRPVPDEVGYEVSSFGHIRSLDRTIYVAAGSRCAVAVARRRKGKVLGTGFDKDGYPTFCGSKYTADNKPRNGVKVKKRYKVSRTVCWVFNGPPPSVMHVHAAHNDGNPLNNKASNLRWSTVPQNSADRFAHGTDLSGEKNCNSKIKSAASIIDIFQRYASGESSRSIATSFGMGFRQVLAIIWRERWRHVDVPAELIERAQAIAMSRPGPTRYANRLSNKDAPVSSISLNERAVRLSANFLPDTFKDRIEIAKLIIESYLAALPPMVRLI